MAPTMHFTLEDSGSRDGSHSPGRVARHAGRDSSQVGLPPRMVLPWPRTLPAPTWSSVKDSLSLGCDRAGSSKGPLPCPSADWTEDGHEVGQLTQEQMKGCREPALIFWCQEQAVAAGPSRGRTQWESVQSRTECWRLVRGPQVRARKQWGRASPDPSRLPGWPRSGMLPLSGASPRGCKGPEQGTWSGVTSIKSFLSLFSNKPAWDVEHLLTWAT